MLAEFGIVGLFQVSFLTRESDGGRDAAVGLLVCDFVPFLTAVGAGLTGAQATQRILILHVEFRKDFGVGIAQVEFLDQGLSLTLDTLGGPGTAVGLVVAAVVSLGRARTGAGVDLPHGYRAEKESDGVRIFVVRDVQPYEAPYAENALLPDGRTVTRIAETQPDLKRGSVIDADKVPCGAVYRKRRAGDKFHQAGGKRKLLSDWLTDKKIPLHSRDELICLAVGNEILAIVDIAAGESVKIDTNTKTAVRLTAGRKTQDE